MKYGPALPARTLVGILGAGKFGRLEAGADLDGLHRIDRHHRRGEVGAELAVDRGAPAGRGAPSATTSITAPTELPALRMPSR